MSRVLSSTQQICLRKNSDLTIGAPNFGHGGAGSTRGTLNLFFALSFVSQLPSLWSWRLVDACCQLLLHYLTNWGLLLLSYCKCILSITACANRSWSGVVGVGRRLGPPGFWNLTFSYYIFSKKGCFLSFEREKWNFTACPPPPGKILMVTSEKIHYCPHRKKSFRRPWVGWRNAQSGFAQPAREDYPDWRHLRWCKVDGSGPAFNIGGEAVYRQVGGFLFKCVGRAVYE